MKLLRLIVAAALGAALWQGGARLWRSEALALKQVEVAGNRQVGADAVVSASRLRPGIHLLSISTGGVAVRVESLPWVHTARVERIVPSRVRITVTERQPAVVAVVGGVSYLVDSSGVVLEEGGADGLVRMLEIPPHPVAPGDVIALPQFSQALTILASLPDEIGSEVTAVRAATPDRITLELAGGVAVVYGAAERLQEKNYAILALIEAREGAVASIDVRVPRRPAVVPR